ncbi:MAG: type II toxin-antitoxin system prevent-host-death family antitoxin [Verrucomicrobiota bacterium]
MIVGVRESKARLSELVAKAEAGEEVVITVRGRPSVRMVPIAAANQAPDNLRWAKEIRKRLKKQRPGAPASSSASILEDLRADRF